MYKTTHPEQTVSFRIEERPTGKVFVFLTDHECTAALPANLLKHVQGADLLVQDGQYPMDAYETRFGGFGHATPEYCATVAHRAEVKRLGITHHDINATDADVGLRLAEAKRQARELGNPRLAESIFACACYQKIDV
jgi:ribonuclease BN (tRNA processing enzyme)